MSNGSKSVEEQSKTVKAFYWIENRTDMSNELSHSEGSHVKAVDADSIPRIATIIGHFQYKTIIFQGQFPIHSAFSIEKSKTVDIYVAIRSTSASPVLWAVFYFKINILKWEIRIPEHRKSGFFHRKSGFFH